MCLPPDKVLQAGKEDPKEFIDPQMPLQWFRRQWCDWLAGCSCQFQLAGESQIDAVCGTILGSAASSLGGWGCHGAIHGVFELGDARSIGFRYSKADAAAAGFRLDS